MTYGHLGETEEKNETASLKKALWKMCTKNASRLMEKSSRLIGKSSCRAEKCIALLAAIAQNHHEAFLRAVAMIDI
ncbi:hypothetical protein OUZ56_010677 [Daphnia magna]|uniref:Uncharacterized protein n=1 Tax=Daphnia magna TaxID=35525 RepID=A0ABR0AJ81_9CRUS|nr:hypothetical protein OUZ56_010677 [Daphnia magna]